MVFGGVSLEQHLEFFDLCMAFDEQIFSYIFSSLVSFDLSPFCIFRPDAIFDVEQLVILEQYFALHAFVVSTVRFSRWLTSAAAPPLLLVCRLARSTFECICRWSACCFFCWMNSVHRLMFSGSLVSIFGIRLSPSILLVMLPRRSRRSGSSFACGWLLVMVAAQLVGEDVLVELVLLLCPRSTFTRLVNLGCSR